MRSAILPAAISGLALMCTAPIAAQTGRDRQPPPVVFSTALEVERTHAPGYEFPWRPYANEPYYVSDGLNGNEVYPKVDTWAADQVMSTPESTSCAHQTCRHACRCQWLTIQADWLSMDRNNQRAPANIIGGPDAANFGDLGLDFESGYRVGGAVQFRNWELEGVYSNLSPWSATNTQTLTRGVSFDNGIAVGGAWLNQNFINQNTLFAPIFAAATNPNATDEFDGFGPGDGFFAGDPPPTLAASYRSHLAIAEANLRQGDYSYRGRAAWRAGVGLAYAALDETATATLTGTFRAQDSGGGPFSGGLTHADLTDPAAGNLALISGPGTGFDDQTGGTQAPAPDTLMFLHSATTDNNLMGVQVLLDTLLYDNRRIQIQAGLKVGVYGNLARGTLRERYSEVTGDGDVYGRDFTDSTRQVAFLGNVRLTGSYAICDWLDLRGGYEVNYLSGVAVSPDQRATGGSYTIDTSGTLTAHGFNLGLEGRY